MQERGMESDPRYALLVSLMRAKPPNIDMSDIGQGHQLLPQSMPMGMGMGDMQSRSSPAPNMMSPSPQKVPLFTSPQLLQLRAQIMAYKLLARSKPLPEHIRIAIQGKSLSVKPGGLGILSGPPQPGQLPSMNQNQQVNQASPQSPSSFGGGGIPSSSAGPAPNQTACNVPGMTTGRLTHALFYCMSVAQSAASFFSSNKKAKCSPNMVCYYSNIIVIEPSGMQFGLKSFA